jgi:hypothetical protein
MLSIFKLFGKYTFNEGKLTFFTSTAILQKFMDKFEDNKEALTFLTTNYQAKPLLEEHIINNSFIFETITQLIDKNIISKTEFTKSLLNLYIDSSTFNEFLVEFFNFKNMAYSFVELEELQDNIEAYLYVSSVMIAENTNSATYILNKGQLNKVMISLKTFDNIIRDQITDLKLTVLLYK